MYRKRFLFATVLSFLVCFLISRVDAAPTMWIQTYDGGDHDTGCCVIETSDGGFAFVGYAYLGGKDDAWLVKTDAAGNEQWKQMYGGTEWDEAYSVVETSDGGYAIAGMTWSFGSSGGDVWLVKTDASGVAQWNQTYNQSMNDYGYSMVQTSDGGYAIAGATFYSTNPGSRDFWLVKTDAAGNEQFKQMYGGTEWDEAYSVVETSDGGYAMVGYTSSLGAGSQDFWLVKAGAFGSELWNRTYGGMNSDEGKSLVETSDGGYAITGYTESYGAGSEDVWLVKTDGSGNMEWNQTYGGMEPDFGHSMIETSDGGFAIVGYTESFGSAVGRADVWLIKTDSAGTLHWNQTYGGLNHEWDWDVGSSVVETSDGGFVIAGDTQTTFLNFKDDFLMIKTDEYGVVPEAAWVVLPILVIATLSILIGKKKLRHLRS